MVILFSYSNLWNIQRDGKMGKNTSKFHVIQTAVYLFLLSVISFIATFPLSYISYRFSKAYHISTQNFSLWMKDEVIDFLGRLY